MPISQQYVVRVRKQARLYPDSYFVFFSTEPFDLAERANKVAKRLVTAFPAPEYKVECYTVITTTEIVDSIPEQ